MSEQQMTKENTNAIFEMWMQRLEETAAKLLQSHDDDDDEKLNKNEFNKCIRIIKMLKNLNDENNLHQKERLITMFQIFVNKRACCEMLFDQLKDQLKI